MSVAAAAPQAAFWTTLAQVGNQLMRFGLFVLLARLVSPAEFGLVAIASILVELFLAIANAGITDAVVQRETLTEEEADTAFWMTLGAGVLFFSGFAGASGLIAGLFAMPQLGPVLVGLAVIFILWPLEATHMARLSRALRFRTLAFRTLTANFVAGVAGIAIALNGDGVWALVWRSIIAAAVQAAFVWAALRWTPRLRFQRSAAVELGRFGVRMMATQIVGQLNTRWVELAAAMLLTPVAVGLLMLGGQCVNLLMQLTVAPFAQLALPLLSRATAAADPAELRNCYLQLTSLSAILIYPAFFGTAAIATELFPLVFGSRWTMTREVMPALCLVVVPLQLTMFLGPTLAAAGRPDAALRWSLIQLAVTAPVTILGATFGLLPLIAAAIGSAFLVAPVALVWLNREFAIPPGSVLRDALPPMAAAGAMGVVAHLTLIGVRLHHSPHYAIAAAILAGVIVYGGLLAIIAPARVASMLRLGQKG
jgi:O-antigen/teichoic acid export membrane protein